MIDLSNISFYWLFFIICCLFNVLIMESIYFSNYLPTYYLLIIYFYSYIP